MNEKIATFLKANHLLHLCVVYEGAAYGASCFYLYDDGFLLFASNQSTNHMRGILSDPRVAGTIACCEQEIAKLRGVQFRGVVRKATKEQKKRYYRKYPLALSIGEPVWAIELEWIKMTDNRLGFGKKIEWFRYDDKKESR